MVKSQQDLIPYIKHPAIRALLRRLPELPERVREKSERAKREREFRRRVWEDACVKAGFITRPK